MSRATPLRDHARMSALFGLGVDAQIAALKVLAGAVRTEWIGETRSLASSQRAYRNGILPEFVGQRNGRPFAFIMLAGTFPNMVEQGVGPYDLRETVLRSPKAHTSRAGHKYLAIPFRHMLPGATGKNAPEVGSAYAGSHPVMGNLIAMGLGQKIADIARNLKGKARIKDANAGPLLRDRHVSPIYAGMGRTSKQYKKTTQSKYSTFRMISTNPDTFRADAGGMNWMHPGIKARHLADRVQERIPGLAGDIWGAL